MYRSALGKNIFAGGGSRRDDHRGRAIWRNNSVCDDVDCVRDVAGNRVCDCRLEDCVHWRGMDCVVMTHVYLPPATISNMVYGTKNNRVYCVLHDIGPKNTYFGGEATSYYKIDGTSVMSFEGQPSYTQKSDWLDTFSAPQYRLAWKIIGTFPDTYVVEFRPGVGVPPAVRPCSPKLLFPHLEAENIRSWRSMLSHDITHCYYSDPSDPDGLPHVVSPALVTYLKGAAHGLMKCAQRHLLLIDSGMAYIKANAEKLNVDDSVQALPYLAKLAIEEVAMCHRDIVLDPNIVPVVSDQFTADAAGNLRFNQVWRFWTVQKELARIRYQRFQEDFDPAKLFTFRNLIMFLLLLNLWTSVGMGGLINTFSSAAVRGATTTVVRGVMGADMTSFTQHQALNPGASFPAGHELLGAYSAAIPYSVRTNYGDRNFTAHLGENAHGIFAGFHTAQIDEHLRAHGYDSDHFSPVFVCDHGACKHDNSFFNYIPGQEDVVKPFSYRTYTGFKIRVNGLEAGVDGHEQVRLVIVMSSIILFSVFVAPIWEEAVKRTWLRDPLVVGEFVFYCLYYWSKLGPIIVPLRLVVVFLHYRWASKKYLRAVGEHATWNFLVGAHFYLGANVTMFALPASWLARKVGSAVAMDHPCIKERHSTWRDDDKQGIWPVGPWSQAHLPIVPSLCTQNEYCAINDRMLRVFPATRVPRPIPRPVRSWKIRPDFTQWISRFPALIQQRLLRVFDMTISTIQRICLRRKMFVKWEKLDKFWDAMFGLWKGPRPIEPCNDYVNVDLGPSFFATSKCLRRCMGLFDADWNPWGEGPGMFTYAPGLCSEELALWLRYTQERGLTQLVFSDFERFDSSINENVIQAVSYVLSYFGWSRKRIRRAVAFAVNHMFMSSSGIKVERRGGVSTGWPGTTVFNTLISLCLFYDCCIRQGITTFMVIAAGDDSILALPPGVKFDPELLRDYGVKPKTKITMDERDVEFLSGRFYRVEPYLFGGKWLDRVHGPKVGKQLLKIAWDLKGLGDRDRRAKLKAELIGHQHDWRNVPVLRVVLAHGLRLLRDRKSVV